jgi:hypothetical protein
MIAQKDKTLQGKLGGVGSGIKSQAEIKRKRWL